LERQEASRDLALIGVQHHHAHVAGVMAECGLYEPVLGVALDGTGYGPDGTVWGGEFLLADRAGFERVAHFKTYAMPGGERAIEEPWRMAYSIAQVEGLVWPPASAETPQAGPSQEELAMALRSGINCPLTSSAGRLFDAVAALLGLCSKAQYEAQGAIRLEAASELGIEDEAYQFAVRADSTPWVLDFGPTLRELVDDAAEGTGVGVMAARFHNTVAAAVAEMCGRLSERHRIRDVALSGGVFQNRLLLTRLAETLERVGLTVRLNSLVPPNDGGLSLGQAAVAAARIGRGD
jgi:hydrogenase maturation protein HypF